MNNKKKILTICLSLLIVLFFCGYDINFDETGILNQTTKLGNTDPATITYNIVNYALLFLGIITVVMIIVAGFIWMFAAGEEEKIKKAQGILKGAILGLVIIMASYGIAQYIFDKLVYITALNEDATQTEESTITVE